ncbi:hypothetical protein GPECTOR_18g153 [Gonium pectorale]|uniref:phytol kinase n=1 Tax=Gonium pectorale TaxID=33097 RepID=A0A150GJK3_GONPE|nr:hypothetical protein GPECTOR_18g153 [Gonium pectorale]|eukprot:KXZ49998.1 hypothetical protein GPECTOR_18g153 [Gonium pectorale]
MAASHVIPIALDALQCARRFLLLGTRPEAEGAVAEAAGWWRLVAAVAAGALQHGGVAAELRAFGQLLADAGWDSAVRSGALALPSEPPPALAAALDGGLLRCLELLLRRAGRAPDGPEAAVVRAVVLCRDRGRSLPAYVGPLLAYGEPRQAAALVATLRKLLRTSDRQALSAEYLAPEDNWHQVLVLAVEAVLDAVQEWDVLEPASSDTNDQVDVSGAAPGGGPSPAAQQLVRLLSCAACEWLPELARAVMVPESVNQRALYIFLSWLPLLAARCSSPQPCQPAVTTPAPGEGGGPDGGRAAAAEEEDGGWRALLLEEVGAVRLLDRALQLVPQLAELGDSGYVHNILCYLVLSCGSVAAVYTGQRPPPSHAAVGSSGEAGLHADAAVTAGAAGEPFRGAVPAGQSRPSTPQPLPWRPELLREAAAQLRTLGAPENAEDAEGLAAYLERRRGDGGVYEELHPPLVELGPLSSALLPPAEARRLLPGRCANPACTSLEGDSEADLTLKACAGCGAVGYCCRPCQLEHWRAGHKGACGRVQGGGGA